MILYGSWYLSFSIDESFIYVYTLYLTMIFYGSWLQHGFSYFSNQRVAATVPSFHRSFHRRVRRGPSCQRPCRQIWHQLVLSHPEIRTGNQNSWCPKPMDSWLISSLCPKKIWQWICLCFCLFFFLDDFWWRLICWCPFHCRFCPLTFGWSQVAMRYMFPGTIPNCGTWNPDGTLGGGFLPQKYMVSLGSSSHVLSISGVKKKI